VGVKGRSNRETFLNPPVGVPICGLTFSSSVEALLRSDVMSDVTFKAAPPPVRAGSVRAGSVRAGAATLTLRSGETRGEEDEFERYDNEREPVGERCMWTVVGGVGVEFELSLKLSLDILSYMMGLRREKCVK